MSTNRTKRNTKVVKINEKQTKTVKVRKKRRQNIKALTLGEYTVQKSQESKQIPEDPFLTSYQNLRLIEPPFDLIQLSNMTSNSSELGQCIEAMEINIDGFGGRFINRLTDDEDIKNLKPILEDELEKIDFTLNHLNPDYNLTKLRRKTRKDIEGTGNGYWEIVRDGKGGFHSAYFMESHTMRISKLDDEPTDMSIPIMKKDFTIGRKKFKKRFQRFCQIRGSKKVWFKEYNDPRVIDCRTGEVANETLEEKFRATEVIHFKIHSPGTPYGIPRYIGNLFSILGSRASDEINFLTFQNNNIPSMAIVVSNAQLTDGTIERIEEFVESHVKRSKNRSAFLILEAEPFDEDGTTSPNAKIETQDLTKSQNNDQLFQEYDKNNADKIRRSFRLHEIFVGKSEKIDIETSEAARKLAEEQIFSPERDEVDNVINMLLLDMEIKFFTYKSNSANVTNDTDLVKIINKSEKSGGITPNLARQLLGEILNRDIPLYDKNKITFDPDEPFSLAIADRVKNMNENAPNQGQIPKPKPEAKNLMKMLKDPYSYVDELLEVSDEIKKYLNEV